MIIHSSLDRLLKAQIFHRLLWKHISLLAKPNKTKYIYSAQRNTEFQWKFLGLVFIQNKKKTKVVLQCKW